MIEEAEVAAVHFCKLLRTLHQIEHRPRNAVASTGHLIAWSNHHQQRSLKMWRAKARMERHRGRWAADSRPVLPQSTEPATILNEPAERCQRREQRRGPELVRRDDGQRAHCVPR